ncbi:MAG: beta-lactamase family protein [Treponema sp.]|jgi:CubicO group peptidase (beta-lactamase class C family)|nr:beta-lactamase family protein [Treponema sp.]
MNIELFAGQIEKQKLACEGVIVLQHGKKIASRHWIPVKPKNVFSVSKSFTSIAVGMAIGEGKLSLADRVTEKLPGLAAKPRGRVSSLTLEHCLTMSRGHGEFSRPQSVAEALNQELVWEPGTNFMYDNGSTFLAGAMLTAVTGKTVRDYLLDKLFRPLGIADPFWQESTDGRSIAATGLEVSIEDMALFGQFLLQRGEWKGKQLVSPAWIDAAGRPHISTCFTGAEPDYDLGYGYCFWPCRHGAYRADGKDGQYIVILPLQDAVVAVTSNEENMKPVLYTVWDRILPEL